MSTTQTVGCIIREIQDHIIQVIVLMLRTAVTPMTAEDIVNDRHTKMSKNFFISILLAIIVLGGTFGIFSILKNKNNFINIPKGTQEGDSQALIKAIEKENQIVACMDSFNINEFSQSSLEGRTKELFSNYYSCRSLIEAEVKYCDAIQNNIERENCVNDYNVQDIFLAKLAAKEGYVQQDVDECVSENYFRSQNFEEAKRDCVGFIEIFFGKNSSICDVENVSQRERDESRALCAIYHRNNVFCNDITDQVVRDECGARIDVIRAIKSGDKNNCNTLSNRDREWVYLCEAQFSDPCDTVFNDLKRSYCLSL